MVEVLEYDRRTDHPRDLIEQKCDGATSPVEGREYLVDAVTLAQCGRLVVDDERVHRLRDRDEANLAFEHDERETDPLAALHQGRGCGIEAVSELQDEARDLIGMSHLAWWEGPPMAVLSVAVAIVLIWIGTADQGVVSLQTATGEVSLYTPNPGDVVSHVTNLDGIEAAFERLRAGEGARTLAVIDPELAGYSGRSSSA